MSAVFDFNASLNDVAPIAPISFSGLFDEKRNNSGLLLLADFMRMHLLCSLPRSSIVSAVFDFNASLSVVAPAPLISFPVDFMKVEKSGLLMDVICVVSSVPTTKIEFSECCVNFQYITQ